jgi:hypothetical protein
MSALPIPGVVYDDQGNENADLGYSSNPCLKDENYRLRRFYWEVERRSQWVRATYPYVDSFRRPIRDFLYINCRYSDAATYYIHWTNRYTLADSFLIRKGESDGQDAQKQSDEQGTLDNILERLRALRHQFDITVQGQPEDPDAGEAPGNGSFDVISSELEGIANSITSGLAERLRAQGFSIDQWMNAVNRHRGLANQMGESAEAEYDPESDLTREDFRDTASALARIELLDALLRPLGEMLSLIDGLLEMGTPHMYVMRDSAPAMKGYEPWTLDPIAAERYFTVLAHATNVQTPAFGAPRFFPKPTVAGPVCFAQAMVYNASGRDVPAGGGSPTSAPGVRQPNTCWDTLNWRFPVKAPEWGADPAGDAKGEAWSVFFGSKPADSYCQVHLNWQAKLVPVGRDRIQALNNSGPPGTIKATAARTADSAALLGH